MRKVGTPPHPIFCRGGGVLCGGENRRHDKSENSAHISHGTIFEQCGGGVYFIIRPAPPPFQTAISSEIPISIAWVFNT